MPQNQLTPEQMSETLRHAVGNGLIDHNENLAGVFLDRSMYVRQLARVHNAFPEGSLHTIAVKALPLPLIVRQAVLFGCGLEVASHAELKFALLAGCDPRKIQYDSPSKTWSELEYALKNRVHINADSIAELERIIGIVDKRNLANSRKNYPSVGIRINPEVGEGKIEYTSTAGMNSKFGARLSENRDEIIAACMKYPWINTLHFHVGSQLSDPKLIIEAAKKVSQLAYEIRQNGNSTLTTINIGGGFPVQYLREKEQSLQFEEWASILFEEAPLLKEFTIVTEYGRFIHANSGWAASTVEYVDEYPDFRSATIHFGAGMLVREAYRASDWQHNTYVCNKHGDLKELEPDLKILRLDGPHCFSGDVFFPTNQMAKVEIDDLIIYPDIGAYTIAMASMYNSEGMPAVYQYDSKNNFRLLKPKMSLNDLMRFWGYNIKSLFSEAA